LELSRAITIDDETERERVFEAQYRIVENVDHVRKAAAARGKAVVPGLPRDESPGGDEELDPDAGGDPAPQVPSGAPRRARDDPSDDESDAPRKRVNVAALPWSERQRRNPQPIRESVRKTLDILENISREFRVAKASLFNDPLRPPFPDSEWENILSGRAVNLDNVLTFEYSLSMESKTVEKVGDFEVAFASGSSNASPAKVVKSHGEHLIAWQRTIEAYEFVFEHRHDELRDYTRHLVQLFKSFPDSLHSRVINYDKAVRLRVAACRNLLLTDFHEFTELHLQWIQNSLQVTAGRDVKARGGASGSSAGRRRDACNRWNAGTCPNSSNKCRYAHVCSVCRSNQHVASECAE
ncbi:hypothetical protein EV122DRAFT_171389, partial [Schizophyllum commune]